VVEAYRIYGSLFFGAAMKLEALTDMRRAPKIIILDMGAILTIDATGLEALENLDNALQRRGGILLLCGLSH
jgi:SulP family sulfate permease